MERVRVPAMSFQKYVSLQSHVLLDLRQCCGSSAQLASCRGLHAACADNRSSLPHADLSRGRQQCSLGVVGVSPGLLPTISGCEALGIRRRLCRDQVGPSPYRSDHCRPSSRRVDLGEGKYGIAVGVSTTITSTVDGNPPIPQSCLGAKRSWTRAWANVSKNSYGG